MNLPNVMNRAYRAYFRRFGHEAKQPNTAQSGVEERVVILANIRGELARYRIDPKTGALRFVAAS